MTARADDVGARCRRCGRRRLRAAGQVATLVLPADSSWSESATGPCPPRPRAAPPGVPAETVEGVARALRSGGRAALLLGGTALRARGLFAASRISGASGAPLLAETFPANLERGAGIPGRRPAGVPGRVRPGPAGRGGAPRRGRCEVPGLLLRLPGQGQRSGATGVHRPHPGAPRGGRPGALEALAEMLGARPDGATPARAARPERPSGSLTTETLAAAIGATLPENAIVVDEGNTAGLFVAGCHRRRSPPRLAHAHRRGHRHRAPRRDGRGRGRARAAGALRPGRRECHVHTAGPLDAGPGRTARDHRGAGQPQLCHFEHGVAPGGRRRRGATCPADSWTSPTPSSTSSLSPGGWACRRAGSRAPKG